jgi:putative acetyltransferase
VTLRRATPADSSFLAEVQETASLAGLAHVYPPDLYPFPVEAVRRRWETFTSDGGWVMRSELGFVAVSGRWLEALYVLPEAWGTGHADELHEAAVAELRRTAVARARLWVLEGNARARRFYERHGWQADGTSRVVEFPPNPTDLGYALSV